MEVSGKFHIPTAVLLLKGFSVPFWVGTGTGMILVKMRKISFFYCNSNPGLSAHRYTDRAILPLLPPSDTRTTHSEPCSLFPNTVNTKNDCNAS
jgi:hypothetical protein